MAYNGYSNRKTFDSSDEEDGKQSKKSAKSSSSKASAPFVERSINDALRQALAVAADPGQGDEEPEVMPAPATGQEPSLAHDETTNGEDQMVSEENLEDGEIREGVETPQSVANIGNGNFKMANTTEDSDDEDNFTGTNGISHSSNCSLDRSILERSRYIPLRLTYEERKTLRLVSAAIGVSDYTTTVDKAFKQKARRQHIQLQLIVAFLSGVIAAGSYDAGQQVLADRNLAEHEESLQIALELLRRYKITNPDKLRSEYGKLAYLLQDAASESLQPLLGLHLHRPVLTVYDVLNQAGALAILEDQLIYTATEEIFPEKGKNRGTLQQEIRRKEKAADALARKYCNMRITAEGIRQCLYSIGDNYSFLNAARRPVQDAIQLLENLFSPNKVQTGYNLGISEGQHGARLSHTHEMQYHYVLQSLTLWAAILNDMFRLWALAEADLFSPSALPYELRNTGQGLQRVQGAPRVFKAMHEILAGTQRELGGWVGTSIIHLGDHNVPNSLVFIDKYAQVARILGPLMAVLRGLEGLTSERPALQIYLDALGGWEKVRMDILHDFFTHGFDGSGGDNFFDAGSCIDGRLTSAWNWCSQLPTKPYYPIFRLAGFASFDGEFDK